MTAIVQLFLAIEMNGCCLMDVINECLTLSIHLEQCIYCDMHRTPACAICRHAFPISVQNEVGGGVTQ